MYSNEEYIGIPAVATGTYLAPRFCGAAEKENHRTFYHFYFSILDLKIYFHFLKMCSAQTEGLHDLKVLISTRRWQGANSLIHTIY